MHVPEVRVQDYLNIAARPINNIVAFVFQKHKPIGQRPLCFFAFIHTHIPAITRSRAGAHTHTHPRSHSPAHTRTRKLYYTDTGTQRFIFISTHTHTFRLKSTSYVIYLLVLFSIIYI